VAGLSSSRSGTESIDFSKLNVVLATHAALRRSGPPQALIEYLRNKAERLLVIVHPLLGVSDFESRALCYMSGETRIRIFHKTRGFSSLRFLLQLILDVFLVLLTERKADIFIGVDSLNAFAGILLRALRKVSTVVYFSVDYVPRRFGNAILDSAYFFLDNVCVKLSDRVWNVSAPMADIRRHQGVPRNKNLVVPAGVNLQKIKHVHSKTRRARTILFVGYLDRIKGVQLIIESMHRILKELPDAELIIVGDGPYENHLRTLVESKGVQENVKLLKPLPYDDLIGLMSECTIGVAPYVPVKQSYSILGDSMKIKEYAACGLPIIMTRVPAVATEVEREGAGIVIDYDSRQLSEAVINILENPELFENISKKAMVFASKYDWSSIFSKAFELTLKNDYGEE